VRNSLWKLFALCWLLCLASPASAVDEALYARILELEAKVEMLELKLDSRGSESRHPDAMLASMLGAETGFEQPAERKIRTKEELEEALQLDETGESQSTDELDSFPEVSTFVAWSNGHRDLVTGLAVELFHDRDKPRRHTWMFKLMLADEWVGFSAGYILVPVINFNIGPFVAKDLRDSPTRGKETVVGLQASVFSF
jgi:hypothetical protein